MDKMKTNLIATEEKKNYDIQDEKKTSSNWKLIKFVSSINLLLHNAYHDNLHKMNVNTMLIPHVFRLI